ncbi:BnaC09g41760D [Brassica napus]|uniref:BnaC09g41760D protein n=1 Tax=Brassica napus TaxID=3708 RepID=A0A078GMR4_BRANA|nr:BnaC09g41760D [Brassica napus]
MGCTSSLHYRLQRASYC